jgi:Rieske Fe-S protein
MDPTASARRRFLIQTIAAAATGCGGSSSSSSSGRKCAADATGPGLNYCLVEKQALRVPGAARFAPGQVTIMLLDDSTGAIVARDSGGFYALSATCTHACCNVNVCADTSCTTATLNAGACGTRAASVLARTGAAFLCPCHGSQYAADGSVLSGPAHLALPSVAMAIHGDDVVVDLSRAVDPRARITG